MTSHVLATRGRRLIVALAVLPSLIAVFTAVPSTAIAGGGGDCVYDPGETCCQCYCEGDDPDCSFGTAFCYETGGGGADYCSSQVCAYETRCDWTV